MLVRNIMTEDVITVDADTSQQDAWKKIIDERIRQVPVIKEGKLVGIVSRTDLLRDMAPAMDDTLELLATPSVRDIMSVDPYTVSPETSFEEAAELMYEKRVGSLPVVEGDRLVGIVTRTDLFRTIVNMLGIGEEDIRMEFDFPSFEAFIDKASSLNDEYDPLSVLTYQLEDNDRFRALLRFRDREE